MIDGGRVAKNPDALVLVEALRRVGPTPWIARSF